MKVLVTGAFGLVGSATVRKLASDGRTVVATDLDVPANRKAAEHLPSGVTAQFADLTDPAAVDDLIAGVSPSAIIHLAAIIPPFIYLRRDLARKVNVDGTAALLTAAQKLPNPPRFIQASSIGVYGSRNPHRVTDLLTAETPPNPADVYGQHKVEAEKLVRASTLDWVILRLGGVLAVDVGSYMKLDNMYLESLLPIDNRVQTVDVRDVATAFAAATTAHVVVRRCSSVETNRTATSTATSRPPLPLRWVWSTACPLDSRAIPPSTTPGSTPTGWTPLGRRKRLTTNTIRGPTC